MSTSAIRCRRPDCGHLIAKLHHSGNIQFEVGIRVVMLKDGRVQAVCTCGTARAFFPERKKAA